MQSLRQNPEMISGPHPSKVHVNSGFEGCFPANALSTAEHRAVLLGERLALCKSETEREEVLRSYHLIQACETSQYPYHEQIDPYRIY